MDELKTAFYKYQPNNIRPKKSARCKLYTFEIINKYAKDPENLLITALRIKHIRKNKEVMKYIISKFSISTINMLIYKYFNNLKLVYVLVEYGHATNLDLVLKRNLENDRITNGINYMERDTISIYLLSKGVFSNYILHIPFRFINSLLWNGGGGIILNKHPQIIANVKNYEAALPYIKRHRAISQILNTLLYKAVVYEIMNFVVYEMLEYHYYTSDFKRIKGTKNMYDIDIFNHVIKRGFT
jgi:hypothetical protein